jgi:putative alpha-1,2-mannosidase
VQGHTNAEPTFQFGSPLFEKVSIQLSEDPGNRLVIETKDNGPENYYVRSLKFNGETIENTWLKRETLMQGGKLVFEMDSVPNKNRGAKVPPPSMNDEWKQN